MAFAETVPRRCLGAEVTCWQRFEHLRDAWGMVGRLEMLRHVRNNDNPKSISDDIHKLLICSGL